MYRSYARNVIKINFNMQNINDLRLKTNLNILNVNIKKKTAYIV